MGFEPTTFYNEILHLKNPTAAAAVDCPQSWQMPFNTSYTQAYCNEPSHLFYLQAKYFHEKLKRRFFGTT